MVITGKIKTVKRVRYHNQECHGITKAVKQFFLIKIAHNTIRKNLFPEVFLHELMHLWFFVCFTLYGLYFTEKYQHRLIDQIVPRMSRLFLKLLKAKGKKKK